MKTWRYAILCAAAMCCAGCRTDPRIALVEQESRRHEDAVYRLQGSLENAQADLDACRRENAALRQQLAAAGGRPSLPPGVAGPALPSSRKPGPADDMLIDAPRIDISAPAQDAVPPTLMPRKPAGQPSPRSPQRDGGPAKPDATPPAGAAPREAIKTSSGSVRRISLVPEATRGVNSDGQPGDDGLSLMIQTWDSKGRLVQAPGEISVVVLDRELEGEAARVARWDFSPQQLAEVLQQSSAQDGIYLEMNWPNTPPAHGNLQVFVRYLTEDGRKLEANLPVRVAMRGEPGRQWSRTKASPASESGLPEPTLLAPNADPPPPPRQEARPAASEPTRDKRSKRSGPAKPERQAERPTWSPYR